MADITDHDLILEMRGDIKLLQADVRDIKENQKSRIDDHESRLRFLERWVWGAIGVIAVAEVLLTIYFSNK